MIRECSMLMFSEYLKYFSKDNQKPTSKSTLFCEFCNSFHCVLLTLIYLFTYSTDFLLFHSFIRFVCSTFLLPLGPDCFTASHKFANNEAWTQSGNSSKSMSSNWQYKMKKKKQKSRGHWNVVCDHEIRPYSKYSFVIVARQQPASRSFIIWRRRRTAKERQEKKQSHIHWLGGSKVTHSHMYQSIQTI